VTKRVKVYHCKKEMVVKIIILTAYILFSTTDLVINKNVTAVVASVNGKSSFYTITWS
jgi:hypothetical protein